MSESRPFHDVAADAKTLAGWIDKRVAEEVYAQFDTPSIIRWIDEQIALVEKELQRTTDKISVSNLVGKKAAFEAVQVWLTLEAYRADGA